MAVIDASVYVALFNTQEAGHAASRAWLQRTLSAQEPLSAPVLLLAEVAAAISRGVGDTALAHEVVRDVADSGLIQLVPVTPALAARAAAIAADHRVRGCDAIYLAVAEQLDDRLVTLDQQQLQRGAAIVPTTQPQEDLVLSGDEPMADANRRALQAYLDRPLDDLMAELELYDPASRGPADVWRKVAGPVRQRLCVEWDYCNVRQDARWENDLDLMVRSPGPSSNTTTPTAGSAA